jgi:dihydrofolate synthase/folylpolyglutamate synthase
MDHVVSLGPSLADIAWHKAGIIKAGGVVVVGGLPDEARQVIEVRAREQGARVVEALPLGCAPVPTMHGGFQRTNAAIAHTIVGVLREQGFAMPEAAVRVGMGAARLPGRLEPMPIDQGPEVWIDGAHNADKIAAVAREAHLLVREHALPVIVLGLLAAKDATVIIDALIPAASAIVTTQPTVVGKTSLPATRLAELIRKRGFSGDIVSEPHPEYALAHALDIADRGRANVLATGSLYLAGELRGQWYRDDDIVLQRTPWPREKRPFAHEALC